MKKTMMCMALLACLQAAWAESTLPAALEKRAGEPYVDAVLKATPALKINILAVLGENGLADDWILSGFKSGNMVVTPIKTFETNQTVSVGTFCEPHNCGDTVWTFAYQKQSQALLLQRGDTVLTNAQGAKVKQNLLQIVQMHHVLDRMDW
ncbi:hypothetical protein LVJ82_00260 [Vitreoscilla massiliensis]|uniref:Inhibitor of vertebrate lysozyme n=1 Tax=Vitreoscilla massiliensis TaxID=1689272 RepID=A0ABY4E551_9NEIS|nr:hypothetical protein [Vitreoscilla massiliensis]UOO89448.1 hypothetical protein LVJ82_00260 [Vitreoscilla massiliensis]